MKYVHIPFPSVGVQTQGSIGTPVRGPRLQGSPCLTPPGRMSCPPASQIDDRHWFPSHNTVWKVNSNLLRISSWFVHVVSGTSAYELMFLFCTYTHSPLILSYTSEFVVNQSDLKLAPHLFLTYSKGQPGMEASRYSVVIPHTPTTATPSFPLVLQSATGSHFPVVFL